MIYKIADNITSPLGMNTEQNYHAVKNGSSALCRYINKWNLKQPFTASLFSDEQMERISVDGMSRFESLVIHSVKDAITHTALDISKSNVLFILSTTKANIELIEKNNVDHNTLSPAVAAQRIAEFLGITTSPVVVSNACISGVAAINLALRMLDNRLYDYAVVCGADIQSKFTVAGFQSLMAIAEDDCRPFDIERIGLNLGEAAATMVFKRDGLDYTSDDNLWTIKSAAVRNDAFHLSSPSRNGDGAWMALKALDISMSAEPLGFINAHGTATLFNDQMEAVAITRAGFKEVPVNGLKGYFGHTLGAAGVLETVISMAAADQMCALPTRGFSELGVSENINVIKKSTSIRHQSFIKMISGFGGGNAALLASKSYIHTDGEMPSCEFCKQNTIRIDNYGLTINGTETDKPEDDAPFLTSLYKKYINDWPKFYKMDGLSRLGFVASEILIQAVNEQRFIEREDRAVVLFNHTSSIQTDLKFQKSIANPENCFPSPSVFIYTLPNIVTGEIAIRNKYHGESSLFILKERNERQMSDIIKSVFLDKGINSMITGWIDYWDEKHFFAELSILQRVF